MAAVADHWPPHPSAAAAPIEFAPNELPPLASLQARDLAGACVALAALDVLANPHHEPQVAAERRPHARDAAVLLGCELAAGTALDDPAAPLQRLVLIERASGTRFAGHIAFPGGHRDDSDAGPIATALRECEEEIGLSRAALFVQGVLPPYYSHAGHRIFAVVATITANAPYRLDPKEARCLLRLPISSACQPTAYRLHVRSRQPHRANYQFGFDEANGRATLGGPTLSLLLHLYAGLAHTLRE